MMIVWQGFGFLAILAPVVVLVISDLIFGKDALGASSYVNEIALLVSAAIVWFVGVKLNGKPGRELVDPKTNEKIILKSRHTFFWIPMQWFAVVIIVMAVAVFSKHFR